MTGKTFAACGLVLALVLCVVGGYLAWLPDIAGLKSANPKTTKYMELYVRRLRARGAQAEIEMRWVPLEGVSPYLRCAVLIAEDDRFYAHRGVDWESLKDAARYNWRKRRWARGASTITQQVARNLFLSPRKDPRRKLRELLIARYLERSLPKERILEIYLNVVEWGEGVFGAEAACRRYFGKSAAEVTAAEASALAAALSSPYRFNPARQEAHALKKAELYLERMRRSGCVKP